MNKITVVLVVLASVFLTSCENKSLEDEEIKVERKGIDHKDSIGTNSGPNEEIDDYEE